MTASPPNRRGALRVLTGMGVIMGLTLVAQLLAFGRNLVLTPRYGRSPDLDAFNLAFVLTTAVGGFLTSAVATVLLPELVRVHGIARSKPFVRWSVALSVVVALGCAALVALGAPVIAPGLGGAPRRAFVAMFALLVAAQPLRVLTALAAALAQSRSRFVVPKILAIVPVLAPLLFLLLRGSLVALCVTVLAAYAVEAVGNLAYAARFGGGELFRGGSWALDADGKAMLVSTLPLLLSSSVFQVQVMFTSSLAGRFGPGVITLYGNATQLVSIVQGLIVANLMLVLYPRIARLVEQDMGSSLRRLEPLLALTNALVIVVVCFMASDGQTLVALLFQRGQITAHDARFLWLLALGLMATVPLSVMRDYVYRIFYAARIQRIPARNSLITVAFNIAMLLLTAPWLGVWSIVASLFAGSVLSLLMILFAARRAGVEARRGALFGSFAVWLTIGGLTYIALRVIPHVSANRLLDLTVRGLACVVIFAALGAVPAWRSYRELRD